jgi:hypothetical protein
MANSLSRIVNRLVDKRCANDISPIRLACRVMAVYADGSPLTGVYSQGGRLAYRCNVSTARLGLNPAANLIRGNGGWDDHRRESRKRPPSTQRDLEETGQHRVTFWRAAPRLRVGMPDCAKLLVPVGRPSRLPQVARLRPQAGAGQATTAHRYPYRRLTWPDDRADHPPQDGHKQ